MMPGSSQVAGRTLYALPPLSGSRVPMPCFYAEFATRRYHSGRRIPLCVTMHHGHSQRCQKSKGDKAMCAHCLASGTRVEETSTHVHHECETPKAVWAMVAEHWKRATGEDLEVSSPLLTNKGPCNWGRRRRSAASDEEMEGDGTGMEAAALGDAAAAAQRQEQVARGIPRKGEKEAQQNERQGSAQGGAQACARGAGAGVPGSVKSRDLEEARASSQWRVCGEAALPRSHALKPRPRPARQRPVPYVGSSHCCSDAPRARRPAEGPHMATAPTTTC